MTSLKDLPRIDRVIRGDDGTDFVVLPYAKYKKFIASLELEGELDEAAYMKSNPDVAKAIRERRVVSGKAHYLTAGYVEGRRAKILR